MYRHVYYDKKKSEIHENTWDEDGARITRVTDFKPFLLTETEEKTNYKSIYGTYLKPHKFDNDSKRYWFVENKDERVFYNLPPEQQYLIAKYRKIPQEEFTENPIRTFFLDIEAPAKSEFPEPKDAKYEIDLMTIYDSLTEKYYMWGKKSWNVIGVEETLDKLNKEKGDDGKLLPISPDDIVYYEIEDEKERLTHMLDFWVDNYPDVYTGWNINGFDTVYIVNRLKLVLGGKHYQKLSPFGKVTGKEGFDKFGNPEIRYNIHGINVMDYMDVFSTFTFKAERESWALDAVASDILNCGKVDAGMSLYDLSVKDWSKYSLYNLVDVALLVSLDVDTEFLETARQTSYEGFSNFVESLGKIKVINGSIAASAVNKGMFIPSARRSQPVSFEGGFVKEPTVGLTTNLFTFDITSLYPTNMISLNTSPETKVGSIQGQDGEFIIYSDYGTTCKVREDKFLDELRDKGYCVSKADVIFDLNKSGIVIEFVQKQFDNKSLYSKRADECLSKNDEEGAKYWQRKAKITKIFLNSCYGMISAASSPLYDLDIARSITLTGQGVTKNAIDQIQQLFEKSYGCTEDPVVAGDTDSVMITFDEVVKHYGKEFFADEALTSFGKIYSNKIGDFLNKITNDWARDTMACTKPTYNFGREKACPTALFFAKKQYAYYVLDNEGFPLPEKKRMKYTGLKVIKSEYSPMIKGMFNELYSETLTKYLEMGHKFNRTHLCDLIAKHKKQFFKASFSDVSKRQKANNLSLYENGGSRVNNVGSTVITEGFKERYVAGSRCPAQVKSCIFHNRIIEDLGLKGKYQQHQGGVKALWSYVEPNEYGIESIAGNNGNLPEEFGLKINYEKQWEKMYLTVAKQLFDTVEWIFPNLKHDEEVDFDELFG